MFLLNKAHLDVCVPILKSSLEEIIDKPLKASSARTIIAKLAGYNTYSGLCDALKNGAIKLDPWSLPEDTFFDVVHFIGKTHKVTLDHDKRGNLMRILLGLKYALMGKPELDDKNVSESIYEGIKNSQVIDNYLYALVGSSYSNCDDVDDWMALDDLLLDRPIDLRHAFTDAESKVSAIVDDEEFFWEYVDEAEGYPDWEPDWESGETELAVFEKHKERLFKKHKERLLKEPELLDEVFGEYAGICSAGEFGFHFGNEFGATVNVYEIADLPFSIRELLTRRFGSEFQVVTWSFCSFRNSPEETLRQLGSGVQRTQLYAAILSKGQLIFLGDAQVYSIDYRGIWDLYDICDMDSETMVELYKALKRYALEQGCSEIYELCEPFGNVHFSLRWEERNVLDNNQSVNAWLAYQALTSIRCELDLAYFDAQDILFPDHKDWGDGDRHYVFSQIELNKPSNMRVVGWAIEFYHNEEEIERFKVLHKKQAEDFEHLKAMTRELDVDGKFVNISYNPWDTDNYRYRDQLLVSKAELRRHGLVS